MLVESLCCMLDVSVVYFGELSSVYTLLLVMFCGVDETSDRFCRLVVDGVLCVVRAYPAFSVGRTNCTRDETTKLFQGLRK